VYEMTQMEVHKELWARWFLKEFNLKHVYNGYVYI